jgi:DNA mismatch repair ATPase MutS
LSNFCIPEFKEDNSIEFDGIYHPLLEKAVLNNGKISRNSIVTGPNASGKSTFIKALAVNSILAQTINTCTASKYCINRSLVMTSMAVRDSLIQGDSYFITEIKSLKRVLDKMDKIPVTCFIDEILRGTNTIERIAASSCILRHLSEKDCLCMVASHDIELTKIMEGSYNNYHFSEKVGDEGVSFDFKLKDGAANTRNAIRLLGFLDYDKNIVDSANQMVESYVKTGSW